MAVNCARIPRQAVPRQPSPERQREFDDILSRHLPRFRRLAGRWLRNAEDIDDAVQDAMLSAFRNLGSFDGRAQMSTWLTKILINAVRLQLRRRFRRQILSIDETSEDGQWAISDLLADPRPSPEQTLVQLELRELVTKLSRRLSPSQRTALYLSVGEDLSTRGAAARLGVPVGTVKARLARGRAELKQRFEKAIEGRKGRLLGSTRKSANYNLVAERNRYQAQPLQPSSMYSHAPA